MAKLRPKQPVTLDTAQQITSEKNNDSLANRATPTPDEIRRVMSALGKLGGPKGGEARAKKLSKKKRIEIAKKAAASR
ncbi:MAG TPA: hypothetical protein VFA15_04995, partial [Nitrososphaera sp.]|nr:hypothetical protein [Nitrososphaera sp.]